MKQHNVVLALFLSLLALPLSAGAAAHKTAPLKVGDHGWKVKTVQIKLNAIGMKTPTTGKYTKDLETQVRAFQRSHRLPSTGKVDDTTYFRIQEAAFEKEGIHGIRGEDVVHTASRYKGGALQLRRYHTPGLRLFRICAVCIPSA